MGLCNRWLEVDQCQRTDVAQGVLIQGDGPNRDEWKVLLVSRGPREIRPALEDFLPHQQHFVQALNAIQDGNELVALTLNGRGVIGATKITEPVS